MLVPVANFLRSLKRWKSLDPILPTGIMISYGAVARRLWIAFSAALILCQ
jgi:hypothetical protein